MSTVCEICILNLIFMAWFFVSWNLHPSQTIVHAALTLIMCFGILYAGFGLTYPLWHLISWLKWLTWIKNDLYFPYFAYLLNTVHNFSCQGIQPPPTYFWQPHVYLDLGCRQWTFYLGLITWDWNSQSYLVELFQTSQKPHSLKNLESCFVSGE